MGYDCTVVVNGRKYCTDLCYSSDRLAQENAATRAWMICRDFSSNGGMLAKNGIVQGLPHTPANIVQSRQTAGTRGRDGADWAHPSDVDRIWPGAVPCHAPPSHPTNRARPIVCGGPAAPVVRRLPSTPGLPFGSAAARPQVGARAAANQAFAGFRNGPWNLASVAA